MCPAANLHAIISIIIIYFKKIFNFLNFFLLSCSDTVTGIGFVPETGILWVAAGTNTVSHFEPKSGDNVHN